MNRDRAKAARILASHMTRSRIAGDLTPSDPTSPPTPCVLALESDSVEQFMVRVTSYPPPVRAAVYYPATEKLFLVTVAPGDPAEGAVRVAPSTTVGMLVEASEQLKLPGRWDEVLRLTEVTPV